VRSIASAIGLPAAPELPAVAESGMRDFDIDLVRRAGSGRYAKDIVLMGHAAEQNPASTRSCLLLPDSAICQFLLTDKILAKYSVIAFGRHCRSRQPLIQRFLISKGLPELPGRNSKLLQEVGATMPLSLKNIPLFADCQKRSASRRAPEN